MKPFRLKSPIHYEREEQRYLLRWANMRSATLPGLDMLFHVPNGGARDIRVAAQLKSEGVKKGVPDLFLMAPRGGYHGLAIELKRRGGGRVSPEQKDWIERLNAQGYRATVCFGWNDARQTIEAYLGQGKQCGSVF